jgi:hypothetical protein
MALRQAGLIFRSEGAISLVITPRAGEAFRIRRIFISNALTGTFCTIINDTARVGYFRVTTTNLGGAHLLNPRSQEVSGNVRGCNLLDWMGAQFQFAGYPVVQGESLTITLNAGSADIYAVGDSYDAADVKSSEQNGSKSSDLIYVNYGTNVSDLTVANYYKVDSSRNPAEMVSFPFGVAGAGLLPAGKKCLIQLIGGQPVGRFVSAGNTANTQYLRPRIGTAPAQTIIDRADVGIPFIGTVPGSGVDYTSLRSGVVSCPRDFEALDNVLPNLPFNGNDELSLQVSVVIAGTGKINAGDIDIWTLQRIFPA